MFFITSITGIQAYILRQTETVLEKEKTGKSYRQTKKRRQVDTERQRQRYRDRERQTERQRLRDRDRD